MTTRNLHSKADWLANCGYDDSAQEMRAAANEIERLRTALQRITHFTSATPSLSESGCGRLLAQIEHEATTALEA